jgi:hypothetical protein
MGGSDPYRAYQTQLTFHNVSFGEIADAGSVDEQGVQILLSRADLLRVGDISWRLTMLGKLSIISVVAAIIMIPPPLFAQVGGAINPGVRVGGTINVGGAVRGAVVRGIPGPDLGTWRSPSGEVHRTRKHSITATKPRR